MKILKPGNIEKPLEKKEFNCWICGCIFEADKTEYNVGDAIAQQHDSIEAECRCPQCGFKAYAYSKGK